MQFRCPNCQHAIRIDEGEQSVNASQETVDAVTCPSCNSRFSLSSDEATTFSPKPGMKIGHFDVLELLGEGAFGTVFKCFDTELNRLVAVKVPRDGRVSSDSSKLFLREARAAAAINHPNVIAVYEVGQHEERFYIASELIDGVTLSEILKLRAYSPKEAAELMVKLLRAVQVFHDKGIVHRDMKSGNILIDTQGEPHIADFGLARREGPQEITVTHDGKIIGTPAYMSPEQARGDTKAITTTSDQYSLGVIFYELLTRDRPFHATNSRTLLHRILTEQPWNPRNLNKSVPVDLDTICVKALEKDPAQRYASVGGMADDIQRFLDGRPIQSRPASILLKLRRWVGRNPMFAVMLFVIAGLVITSGILAIRSSKVPEPIVRIETQKPKTHPVRIGFTLTGNNVPASPKVKWAVVPLDRLTGEPIEHRVQRLETIGDLETPLQPGRYLFVIQVPDFGFHEVFRTVPEDLHAASTEFSPESWKLDAASSLRLPPINVWETSLLTEEMAFVEGGDFEMGADLDKVSPRHRHHVRSFYMDLTESSNEQYMMVRKVRVPDGSPPEYLRLPRVRLSWNAAAHYAEAMGKRLPTEAEFEFAATNRGTSQFPWGNDPALMPALGVHPVDDSTGDISGTTALRNLCSNVAEWTSDFPIPYEGSTGILPPPLVEQRSQSRVIRGGRSGATLDRIETTAQLATRERDALPIFHHGTEYVGVRCAMSKQPQFID